MGEAAESKKSRGGCSTLHNWMGQPSDQDEEEKTLELSLGLPGGEAWRTVCKEKGKPSAVHSSMLSLGYSADFSHSQGKAKGSQAAATGNALACTNNGSQTRSPTSPVIGWPPVRTFRRNLATSIKASLEQQNVKKTAKPEETKRAPFVKINMDGIPIGRKIDLNALDSYEKLSLAVDKLFRGLLAAQQDPLAAGTKECAQEEVAISGILDGTGEYTLVYEDYEGDRVLVGDVPWGMFVSSVKRLRVLKTSDLSSSLTASGQKRTVAEC
ncbi:auxin-responsive protein IAA7-like [Phragmites australis]|uniref:auxin-responsive protein IAA7-like n=1 Tax=Phragmites australis TaxID=29695 RepID=UPI002D785351|nr:auxin-responsive protein IAA7-like [Phragmites australis]XP_062217308.1 auxin-responsive protein IAA7-like [Phragmites australis]XP_062217309.1 auxin-responsive protein IAA7-like [Phragmites australis]XP_062217310.1 auxin-responsive protein IAA7-like [Phragmites australis]